tara:strand:- start:2675 stop:7198 length:4524 start_codon:yes stop_codon:yes gene_type:complete
MNTEKCAKIIGIQFSVLSPQEIRNGSVAEIKKRDTYVNNKPKIGGLFDPRMGVIESGIVCPTDGKNYIDSPGYFGHIELAKPVYYIQYLNQIIKILRCVCFKCSKLLINKEMNSHVLSLQDKKKRWEYVFGRASKIKRCGEDNECGCGTKQPVKISKEGMSTLFAEWEVTAQMQGMNLGENQEIKGKRVVMKLSPEKVHTILRRISDEDVDFMGFSSRWARPDWMICQVLAVPPPAVRPSVKHASQQRSEDDLSHILVNIIKTNNTLKKKIEENAPTHVIEDWRSVLQYYCATMIDNNLPGTAPVAQRSGRPLKSVKQRLKGKPGRVRGNLMGKRVDFSGRSVISPDAKLNIGQLGVPMKIVKNITKPVTVNYRNIGFLTELMRNGPDVWPGAKVLERADGTEISLQYADRETLVLKNGDRLHRHLMDGDTVLFNRQPSLHRMSMMGHEVKVMKKGNTFRFNVADTKPYNADFDGDEMNIHVPQSIGAEIELNRLAAVPKQIISPANNKSIIGIFQDSLLAANRFTRKELKFDKRTAMNLMMNCKTFNTDVFKNKNNGDILNFELLSQIMPNISMYTENSSFDEDKENHSESNNIVEIVNGKFVRGQLDKGIFGGSSGLLQRIFNDINGKHCENFIDDIQNLVTEYMKLNSYSVGISDLIANKITNERINEGINNKKREVKTLIDNVRLGVFENNTGKSNEVEFETRINSLLNEAQDEAGNIGKTSLSKDNRFVIMVNAGSKGNNINIAQMISCLGQQNVDGKRIPYGFDGRTLPHFKKYDDSPEARGFVKSSFIEGLTPEEMFFHAMGGRVGLIDTAVKTSGTGYIQRRLIKSLEDLKVCYDYSVRNNKDKIVQFLYGGDAMDTMKVENQKCKLPLMNNEDIYSYFHIPSKNYNEAIFNIFLKETRQRMKSQKDKFNKRVQSEIKYMIEERSNLVEKVMNFTDQNKFHIPVNFKHIIKKIKNNLHINSTSAVDITPLEAYAMIDRTFYLLSQNIYLKPSRIFKIMYYYFLCPMNILMVEHFNKRGLTYLLEFITNQYKKSIVNPGEMVGIVAAQSVGEPTTQMTLNTFHFAGVSSKSNVTRGVPRIEEILNLSQNPKNPSATIFLKPEHEESIEHAHEMRHELEYTNLRNITKTISIYYDGDDHETIVEKDNDFLHEFWEFEKIMDEINAKNMDKSDKTDKTEWSKWVLRIELNKEIMVEKNIQIEEVNFALNQCYKNKIQCIFSDFNADDVIIRIRPDATMMINKKKPMNADDNIALLKNMMDNILDKTVLKGLDQIKKINLRKIKNHLVKRGGNYVKKDIWVLDTVGTNLRDILACDLIDSERSFTNDIKEVYRTLGIEAARQAIYNEIIEVMSFDGTYINSHHLELLCDRMSLNSGLVSVFRHGINNDDIGPLAKASFEETPEMFLRAARHSELDTMGGISANIMCGQQGRFGTNYSSILVDMDAMKNNEAFKPKNKSTMSDLLNKQKTSEECSMDNLIISNSVEFISNKTLGELDDDYEMDF